MPLNMGTETNPILTSGPPKVEERDSPEYLAQLLKDKKQIQAFPNVFLHTERLIDEEVNRVRAALFHISSTAEPFILPDAVGTTVQLQEKVFVPVKEYPDYNFVGRILGPRGMTAKQLEQETKCKIMVRGKGSMRDKKREEMNRGKPNWEHLNEELHVLITVEDTKNRGEMKLLRAVEEVKKLLVPAPEGEDDLKKRQLMELAIINGTYRDTKSSSSSPGLNAAVSQTQRMMAPSMPFAAMHPALRGAHTAGAPIILAPRMQMPGHPQVATSQAGLMNGGPPPLVSPTDASGLIYSYPAEYPYGLATAAPALFDYGTHLEHSAAGAVPKLRRAVGVREHPYNRVSLP